MALPKQPELGVYWGPAHTGDEYKDHLRAIGGAVRILQADVQHMADAASRTSGEIWPRWWHLDDNNYKVLDDVLADPEGSGERLALAMHNEVVMQEQQAQQRGLAYPTRDRVRLSGINEPPVWTDLRDEFVRHEVRFLDTLTGLGHQANAKRLGVGHPADLDAKQMPIWDDYLPIYDAIKRSKGLHALELHEYWYWSGPQDGWTWLAGRHWRCPWDVDINIGEAGIDLGVDNVRWHNESHRNRGWQGNVTAQEYIAQWEWYFANLDHSRVRVVLPYMFDFQARMWASFDVFPIRHELEAWWANAKKRPYTRVENPFKVFMPLVGINARPDAPVQPGGTVTPPPAPVQTDAQLSWWFVGQMGRVLGIDADLAEAFLEVEAGVKHGQEIPDADMVIRFEPHIFRKFVDAATFDRHFQIGQPIWQGEHHRYRTGEGAPWQVFHGNQRQEWAAYRLAATLHAEGAAQSISMGAGQIMGFNFLLVGYKTAQEMLQAYNDATTGALAQIVGFYAYVVNRAGLLEAVRARDFDKMAELYNGTGQIGLYSRLIREAYQRNVN